jgi:hypothetical protein
MDRYIDNGETQVYGPKFSGAIRRMFPEEGPVQTFMLWCAGQVDASTGTLDDAMASERSAGSTRTAAAEEKLPSVREARGELKAFNLRLIAYKGDQHHPWDGDITLFFPGGLVAIGKGARAAHVALRVARKALAEDLAVPEHAHWLKRLDDQIEQLAPLVERADDASHAHRSALSEQSAEKRGWLRTYRGVSLVLEGVLTMLGREGEYVSAVPHLTAPGSPADDGDGEDDGQREDKGKAGEPVRGPA